MDAPSPSSRPFLDPREGYPQWRPQECSGGHYCWPHTRTQSGTAQLRHTGMPMPCRGYPCLIPPRWETRQTPLFSTSLRLQHSQSTPWHSLQPRKLTKFCRNRVCSMSRERRPAPPQAPLHPWEWPTTPMHRIQQARFKERCYSWPTMLTPSGQRYWLCRVPPQVEP